MYVDCVCEVYTTRPLSFLLLLKKKSYYMIDPDGKCSTRAKTHIGARLSSFCCRKMVKQHTNLRFSLFFMQIVCVQLSQKLLLPGSISNYIALHVLLLFFFACRSAPIDARRRNMAVRAKCIAEIKETPFEPPHYISSYGYCRGSQLPFISDAFSDGYTQSCLVTGLCNVCTANMFRVLGERMKGK